jgi:hypothetical protein
MDVILSMSIMQADALHCGMLLNGQLWGELKRRIVNIPRFE